MFYAMVPRFICVYVLPPNRREQSSRFVGRFRNKGEWSSMFFSVRKQKSFRNSRRSFASRAVIVEQSKRSFSPIKTKQPKISNFLSRARFNFVKLMPQLKRDRNAKRADEHTENINLPRAETGAHIHAGRRASINTLAI